MDHLENILPPSVLNGINLDIVTEVVLSGDIGVGDLDLARVVEAGEVDDHIGVLWPLLELPLHLDLGVIGQLLVNALNVTIKHL